MKRVRLDLPKDLDLGYSPDTEGDLAPRKKGRLSTKMVAVQTACPPRKNVDTSRVDLTSDLFIPIFVGAVVSNVMLNFIPNPTGLEREEARPVVTVMSALVGTLFSGKVRTIWHATCEFLGDL